MDTVVGLVCTCFKVPLFFTLTSFLSHKLASGTQ
jgi:hypothetical protein